jgi:serine/threonine protein kinase
MSSKADLSTVAKSLCDNRGYTYGDSVGRGAFKKVFHVKGKSGEEYALKLLKGDLSAQRTHREIEALKRCNHANIAKLFGTDTYVFEGRKYSFTLEEFLSGGTLTEWIKRHGSLNDEQLNELATPLINAISYIADLGLVHRDIKPDNIMFREDEITPVLVDFNLVRDLLAASLTQSWLNRGPGTPYFASPEQLNNQKRLIDWRTDQFSLGVTLCYARFGVHPYKHPDESDLSPKTVERVATRGAVSDYMLDKFKSTGLVCLERMIKIWPVERFRRPKDLETAWQNKGGM